MFGISMNVEDSQDFRANLQICFVDVFFDFKNNSYGIRTFSPRDAHKIIPQKNDKILSRTKKRGFQKFPVVNIFRNSRFFKI